VRGPGDLSYAQARVEARHGERPDDALWARLDASKSLAHYLDDTRGTCLERWTRAIDARRPAGELEATLRRSFRAYAAEIASWLPERWRPGLSWASSFVDLPLLEGLGARGGASGERDDPDLVALADAMPAGDGSVLERWTRRQRDLWPRLARTERTALAALEALLEHHGSVARAAAAEGAGDSWRLRRDVAADLKRHFRRFPEPPSSALAHLLLVAIELERLRSALVRRALFGPTAGEAS
jgi:hypothetical protein